MDNFNFNLFKYFYYVVLYNGVTNASKNLSVAQPSLSLSIKNLESQLNKILIDRNKKQFSLTEEGYQLYEILKPIFENIEKNIDFFNNEKKYIEINIGIRYSYAKNILSEFIKNFRYEFPKVKINVDLYSKLNFDKIKNKEYDIVIDDDDYIKQLENVNTDILCELENYFICGSNLYNEYKNINSIKEIDSMPFISYRPSLKTGKFRQYCYKNDVSFLEIFSVNESDLYFKLVKENFGIGISNKLLLKDYLNERTVFIINIEEKIFKDRISIAHTKNNIYINNFISMLKEYIRKELE